MRLDAQPPFVWRQINQFVKDKLGSPNNVYVYRGMHHALFETLVGLHLRFSHKRKIVKETGFGDHLTHVELELAKMGVRFKDEFETDMAKEEKATLAYVHDLDDALTGELYNHIETLKSVQDKKIYRIHLAHHLFGVNKTFVKNLSEYDIIIVSLDQNYALVFAGEKVTLPILTVSQLPWSIENDLVHVVKCLDSKTDVFQPEITQFEASLPSSAKPWFRDKNARRIYDRSVVFLPEHDGAAMMDLLKKTLSVEATPLGGDNKFETPSLCRWQNETWFSQAEKLGLPREQLQGTVIIDGCVVSTAFAQVFKDCLLQLEKLSQ